MPPPSMTLPQVLLLTDCQHDLLLGDGKHSMIHQRPKGLLISVLSSPPRSTQKSQDSYHYHHSKWAMLESLFMITLLGEFQTTGRKYLHD